MWEIRHKHIEEYEKEHNCTHISKLNKYQNWRVLNIPIIKISKMYQYIDNKYLPQIEDYNKLYINKKRHYTKHIITKQSGIRGNWNNPSKNKETVDKNNLQFEKENNCTQIRKLIQMYGQGWLSLKLPKINRNHNAHFISNDYLSLIQDYSSAYHASNKEKDLYNKLKDVYNGKIIHNTKLVIAPQELDIYIPQFKLGIEYNGLFWHSTKHISDINYHLNKSIVCRQKGIRLIHIYEFEDFEEQFTKLISLLNGINLFDPNDFNKNNLSGSTIPKPEIIYKDENYTIYGAGPVYKEVRR